MIDGGGEEMRGVGRVDGFGLTLEEGSADGGMGLMDEMRWSRRLGCWRWCWGVLL